MALSKSPNNQESEERELEHYLSAGDQAPQHGEYVAERDYFSRYLGDKSAEDARLEPELQNLLTKLYDRQREDAHGLVNYFMHSFNNSEIEPPSTLYALNQFKDQYSHFAEERDRHIREYHKAKAILADMNEQSREEQIQHERDDNEPKIAR